MRDKFRGSEVLSLPNGIGAIFGLSQNELSDVAKKLPQKLGKQRNVITLELRHNAFYGNYYEFTDSRRFRRFVDFVDKEINNFFENCEVKKTNAKTGEVVSITSGKNYFKELIRDAVSCHVLEKFEDGEEDPDEEGFSITSIIGKIPERLFSNLWSVNAILENAGIKVKEDEDPFVLQEVENVLYGASVTGERAFDKLYDDALTRACYDYISSAVLINHLNEDNWLFELKNKMTSEQLFVLMTKIFEYTLHSVEDYAACGLICSSKDTKGSTFFTDIYDFMEDKRNTDKEMFVKDLKIEELTRSIESKDRKIEALTEQNEEYRKNAAFSDASRQDNIALQRELKRMKAEYDKLEEKYNALLTDQQSVLNDDEDDVDEEDDSEIISDETNKFKRIVFIRDKKYDGCVIFRKLTDYYPNAKVTNGIATEINANTTDLIVAMTSYTCHGTYWGVKSVSERKDISMISTKKTNLGAIVSQIDKTFQK